MNLPDFKELAIDGIKLVELFINGVKVWAMKTFTNQVPISTDTDGSIFNGVGYIENKRLSSSGGISGSAQNGSVTTGFIPFPDGDKTVIRLKGVEWLNANANYGGHHYVVFYGADKKVVSTSNHYIESPSDNISHILTITRDANGVETFVFNEAYGTTNVLLQNIRNKAKYIRITAHGKGADMIVTINEEIT